MTKKTNSLLFRFGISTVWKNKSDNYQNITNRIQLENIILSFLRKKKIKVLDIKYKQNKAIVYIYNNIYTDLSLRNKIIKYYNKHLDFNKTIEKFGINYKYTLNIVQNAQERKTRILNQINKFKQKTLLLIWFKTFFLKILFRNINKFKFKLFMVFNSILNSNLCFEQPILFLDQANQKNFVYTKNIRKRNSHIFNKLLSIKIENIIFWKCFRTFKLELFPVLSNSNLYLGKNKMYLTKQYNNKLFRDLYFTIILAINYKKADILVQYLANTVKKNKNHLKVLRHFTDFVQKFYDNKSLQLEGLQLRANGKLGGKMRKSKYHFKLGKVQLQTLKTQVCYSICYSYTKFGVISLKIWLLYDKTIV